jgi:hypothetical protein
MPTFSNFRHKSREPTVDDGSRAAVSPLDTGYLFEETEMTQTLISRPAMHVVPELLERCDRCNAAAKIHVTFPTSGDLSFCGHHSNRYAERILATADRIVIESGFTWQGSVA